MAFKVRVRVRVAKSFTTDETKFEFSISGRSVRVVGSEREQKLSEAKWLILTSGPFDTEEAAHAFGTDLRLRLEIASFSCRLGIDGGNDRPTTWINEDWAKSVGLIQPEERVLPNVHGVAVVPNDDLSRFPASNATLVVTTGPEPFLQAVKELDLAGKDVSASVTAVRLMNKAFMTNEPLAQLVLAFSVVEELGQDEKWSDRQREILSEVAKLVEKEDGDREARAEIGMALRLLHRLSLRQGVIRVLNRLGLIHLKADWDRLYGVRSGIFHGTNRLSQDEVHAYTQEVLTLCGKVVVAQLRSEGVEPPSVAEIHFPTLKAEVA